MNDLLKVNYPFHVLFAALAAIWKGGWKKEDLERLANNEDVVKNALAAVRGYTSAIHAIDRQKIPHLPDGYEFSCHFSKNALPLSWDPEKIAVATMGEFFASESSEGGQVVSAEILYTKYADSLGCAGVLDYLIHHPGLVTPAMNEVLEQQGKILFPASKYTKGGQGYVRALTKDEDGKLRAMMVRIGDSKTITCCHVFKILP